MTWTVLHDFCKHQDVKNVIHHCQMGFANDEIMKVDENGSNPLHLACWGNPSIELVQAMMESLSASSSKTMANTILCDQDKHGNTPLHIACANNTQTDPKIIQLLLNAANISENNNGISTRNPCAITNKEGLMPLHVACRYSPDNAGMISQLIQAYPNALRSRIKMGNPAPVRRRQNETQNKEEESSHFVVHSSTASGMGSQEIGAFGKQVRDGAYPLHMAIASGARLDVIEMLIKEADDVLLMANKHGETPLHIALSNHENYLDDENGDDKANSVGILRTLIQYGPNALRQKEKRFQNLPLHVFATAIIAITSDTTTTTTTPKKSSVSHDLFGVAKFMLESHPHSIQERNSEGKGKTPFDILCHSDNNNKSSSPPQELKKLFEMSYNSFRIKLLFANH